MHIHKSVTAKRIHRLAKQSMFGIGSPGVCVACGDDAEGVEPDAEGYTCETCGEDSVFGAEQLLFVVG